MKKVKLLFCLIIFFTNCHNAHKVLESDNLKKINRILIDLSQSYVIAVEATEKSYRNVILKSYNHSSSQFEIDSVRFHQALIKFNSCDLSLVSLLLSDSLNESLNMSLIYSRNAFQNTIKEWDRSNNKYLVKKVLIHDYFVGRKVEYKDREWQIEEINKSFDLAIFSQWFSFNKNLEIEALRSKFRNDFITAK
jgi:hypothetical protein